MKYKVGDKVRVRKDLVPNSEYGGLCYVEHMDKFKDKSNMELTIDNIIAVDQEVREYLRKKVS